MSHDDDAAFSEGKLIEAVENQLRDNHPSFVQAVLNKLTLVGYAREESLQMMALVLAYCIEQMLRDEAPSFDLENYEAHLRNLPDLPPSFED
ncbi:hypothetical protein SAMN05216214_109137 [Atopomonas hussainii]|uniref:Uncharacterized protein n=1 Tax=Atopomonas hussainii TaxID=1429083 RepID=A0A1H7NHN7_9GAMM|nr:hypothetical protein [Atopomonas hussainii]SEL22417.1 hypothetical protein SAMN05216214_109137 [Atopomonas hussainii]